MFSPAFKPMTSPDLGPGMQKSTPLLDTVFNLYGFLPCDEDPRWEFLNRYHSVDSQTRFRPINFENARRATYLSDIPSFATGFITTILPENVLQLDRALDNLSSRQDIIKRFATSSNGYSGHDIRLNLTDSLTTDPTKPKKDVTPCPEALYQLQLFEAGQYLARVGFNVHNEDGSSVISIANIQGRPDNQTANRHFREKAGVSPFNLLVQRVVSLTKADEPPYQVRGVINPARGNSQLYWGVLKGEGIDMHRAYRKDSPVD